MAANLKKILILGAAGMAGHMIYYYLFSLKKYELFTICFRKKLTSDSVILSVYNIDELRAVLELFKPDYIINAVGVLINEANRSPENAVYINAYFPHVLARLIDDMNKKSRLIHISTDCVFSGKKGLYADNDEKDALDVYGMTKNLGEIIDKKNLTIRTSIIGPEIKENGEGLFHWIFSQRENNEINGYEKSIWGGVTTLELAKAIVQYIDHDTTGLFQLSNGERITKYDLIQLIVERFKLNIKVHKIEGVISDKSIIPSVSKNINYIVPSYFEMIDELYNFMNKHKNIYSSYLENK